MKLYTCCPESGCNEFQKMLRLLKSWGIEPAIKFDDCGYYFQFRMPKGWPGEKKQQFSRQLAARAAMAKFNFDAVPLDQPGAPTPGRIADCLRDIIETTEGEYRGRPFLPGMDSMRRLVMALEGYDGEMMNRETQD